MHVIHPRNKNSGYGYASPTLPLRRLLSAIGVIPTLCTRPQPVKIEFVFSPFIKDYVTSRGLKWQCIRNGHLF